MVASVSDGVVVEGGGSRGSRGSREQGKGGIIMAVTSSMQQRRGGVSSSSSGAVSSVGRGRAAGALPARRRGKRAAIVRRCTNADKTVESGGERTARAPASFAAPRRDIGARPTGARRGRARGGRGGTGRDSIARADSHGDEIGGSAAPAGDCARVDALNPRLRPLSGPSPRPPAVQIAHRATDSNPRFAPPS